MGRIGWMASNTGCNLQVPIPWSVAMYIGCSMIELNSLIRLLVGWSLMFT